jgi:hypothetical protein
MTSLTLERFTTPSTARERRELAWLRAWAADELAGRAVWCAAACDGPGHRAAEALRDGLHRPGAGALDVAAPEPLCGASARVEAALAGARDAVLERDDEPACLEGTLDGERLAGERVVAGDVVVVHDALSALLAGALRARGAHVIWHEHLPAGPPMSAAQHAARDVVLRCAGRCDAHLVTWVDDEPSGLAEHLAAALPEADHVEAKHLAGRPGDDADLRATAWSVALADVVSTDREQHVGGMLHARPAVPAR